MTAFLLRSGLDDSGDPVDRLATLRTVSEGEGLQAKFRETILGETANGPQIDHRNPVNRCERASPNAMKNGDST